MKEIIEFIQAEVKRLGKQGVTIGLSGGLDSTITAYLSVKALSRRRVHALILPEQQSSEENTQDAEEVSKELRIKTIKQDITPELKSLKAYELLPISDKNELVNKTVKVLQKIWSSRFQVGFNTQYNKSRGLHKIVQ